MTRLTVPALGIAIACALLAACQQQESPPAATAPTAAAPATDTPAAPSAAPVDFEQLAQRLEFWRQQGRDLAFLIGGPEGHAPDVLAAADETWSLGPLTLPHMLVRLVLAEQLYRAASLLANHPYHRA